MSKQGLEQIGCTSAGQSVYANVFYFVGTRGIPVEIVLEFMTKHNMVVCWTSYTKDAMQQGAKLSTIQARVFSAIGEVFGPVYLREFIKRWRQYE